jgi:hypothetical protein
MKLENVDGFSFDFTDALNAFVFDEKDKNKDTFHGVPMKAVDIIVELQDKYLFVEIKKYDVRVDSSVELPLDDSESDDKRTRLNWLKNYLKYKYRDSYLFRYAENKVDKPIHYLCLINLENALNSILQKTLRRELPVGIASNRWKKEIVSSCQVLNLDKWNKLFPEWPAAHIADGIT